MSFKYIILNTCTLDTHTAVHSGNTLWAPDVFKLYMILNTCTLDTHTAVAPGYTLWAPDVFKLYDLEYKYHYTHAAVDPGNTFMGS